MMKYYQIHEQVYDKLLTENYSSWDKAKHPQDLLTTSVNLTLESFLTEHGFNLFKKTILDLGTGAGNCALFCASYRQ